MNIISIKFKVYGHVQGVYFRKYTKEKADSLKINGFIKNNNCLNKKDSSVTGLLESTNEQNILIMIDWLKTKGSPKSTITNFEILEKININKYLYNEFKFIK